MFSVGNFKCFILPDDLSGGVDGDLIDYEDDGYVAPNMSYVPEGLDEHEISSGAAVEGGKNEEDLLKEGEGEEAEAGDDSFEVSDNIYTKARWNNTNPQSCSKAHHTCTVSERGLYK